MEREGRAEVLVHDSAKYESPACSMERATRRVYPPDVCLSRLALTRSLLTGALRMLKEFQVEDLLNIWCLEGYSYEISPRMVDILDGWVKKSRGAKIPGDERAKVDRVLESIDGDLLGSFNLAT